MITAPDRSTIATAAFGLGGTEPISVPDEAALAAIALDGLTSMLWQAVDEGATVLSPGATERVARRQTEAMQGALRLEQRLLEVWSALTDGGLECRVLKGSAVAHLDYPAPEWRPFNDIDLLVRSRDLDRAAAVLEAQGGRRLFAEPRPGFSARFAKSITVRQDDGIQIDLHRTLAEGPYGQTIVADELFDDPEPFVLADRPLLALGAEARFVHACVHTVLGRPRPELRPLRDVAQIDQSLALDRLRVLELTRRWHLGAVVARAILLVDELLGVELHLIEWARTHRPDRFEQRALPAYHGDGASYRRKIITTPMAIADPRDRARFVLALLLPDREYLAERDGSKGRRLAAAAREGWRARGRGPST